MWLRFGRIAVTFGAGLLVGYLLMEIYTRHQLIPKGLLSLVVNKSFAGFLAGLTGDRESAREIMIYLVSLLQAIPGGLFLGGAVGLALGRIRHPRVLCAATLVWPMVLFLALLVTEWVARDGAGMKLPILDHRLLGAWAAVYFVFFACMYIVHLIVRRRGPASSDAKGPPDP